MILPSLRTRCWPVAALLTSFILGCSSLVKQGEDLYEAGLFDEAERKFSSAVSKNPNDIEAINGLAKSREAIIDNGLIEVRMLRLAQNTDAALDKLELVLAKEKAWQTKLNAAIAETQQVEADFASHALIKQMRSAIRSQKPDLARWLAHIRPNLAKTPRTAEFLRQHNSEIQELGHQRCANLSKLVTEQAFFLKGFTESYCGYWNVPVSLPTAPTDATRFRALAIEDLTFYDTGGMAGNGQISSRLKQVFKSSPYYSQFGSSPLPLKMMGTLRYRHFRDQVSQSVSYTDRQEWTETHYEKSIDPNGSITQTPRSITRHQDVPRIHQYTATRHSQTLTLDLKLQGPVFSNKLVLSFNRQDNRQSLEHGEIVPAARLYPQSAELIDFNKWLDSKYVQIEKQFAEKLENFWTTSYCHTHLPTNPSAKAEQLQRCARTNPDHHAVKNWFESNFGIDHNQTWTLLKQTSSSETPAKSDLVSN